MFVLALGVEIFNLDWIEFNYVIFKPGVVMNKDLPAQPPAALVLHVIGILTHFVVFSFTTQSNDILNDCDLLS